MPKLPLMAVAVAAASLCVAAVPATAQSQAKFPERALRLHLKLRKRTRLRERRHHLLQRAHGVARGRCDRLGTLARAHRAVERVERLAVRDDRFLRLDREHLSRERDQQPPPVVEKGGVPSWKTGIGTVEE